MKFFLFLVVTMQIYKNYFSQAFVCIFIYLFQYQFSKANFFLNIIFKSFQTDKKNSRATNLGGWWGVVIMPGPLKKRIHETTCTERIFLKTGFTLYVIQAQCRDWYSLKPVYFRKFIEVQCEKLKLFFNNIE